MQTSRNDKYTYSHPLLVGRPTREWNPDDSAKYLVAALGFLSLGIIFFFMYHFFSLADKRYSIPTAVPFCFELLTILSFVLFVINVFLSVYEMFEAGSLPQFGCFLVTYNAYYVRITVNKSGLQILLSDDWKEKGHHYLWNCPWECLSGITFTKNKRLGTVRMTAKIKHKDPAPYVKRAGGWHYSNEQFGNPLTEDEQKKAFGGRNKIVLHLPEHETTEIVDAINQFSPSYVNN